MEVSDHLVALKVMRLTKPTLVAPAVVTSEAKDLTQNIFNNILKMDPAASGMENLALGQFMLLPQSFGIIYLGESFSSYVCVHNNTTHPVNSVSVRADLQSKTTRINLPIHKNKTLPVTLNPGDTLDDVIHHEVVEIGTHILVCEVSYTTPAGLPASFRKFFKFEVTKPLNVQTHFYDALPDEVYLEALIQNITTGTICLEKIEFESSENYHVTPLNSFPNGESVFPSREMLEPMNSCQFLYKIRAVNSVLQNLNALKSACDVGKLDIVWRSNLGQRGRIQTSQLQRSAIVFQDLRLTIIEAQSITRLGKAFNFKCRITNTSSQPMDLMLAFKKKASVNGCYTGQTDFMLGNLTTGGSKEVELTVCPVKTGLITITDLVLTETFSKNEYKFEDFLQVFVVDNFKDSEMFEMDKNVRYALSG